MWLILSLYSLKRMSLWKLVMGRWWVRYPLRIWVTTDKWDIRTSTNDIESTSMFFFFLSFLYYTVFSNTSYSKLALENFQQSGSNLHMPYTWHAQPILSPTKYIKSPCFHFNINKGCKFTTFIASFFPFKLFTREYG